MARQAGIGRLWRGSSRLALALAASAVVTTAAVVAKRFGPWGPPVSAEQGSDPSLNTAFNDGCPILSPDGLSLYMATNRDGFTGATRNLDIWVARRKNTRSGWGAPVNLGPPVNSPADDFCPTPVIGKGLFFVSKRTEPNGDIYFTRLGRDGWHEPIHLGPNINSPLEEWSPSLFFDRRGANLYFSRNTPLTNSHDIYHSVNFGPAVLAPGGVNGPLSDARPNVRSDGLEIVWDSNRQGVNGQDIWTSSRASTRDPWGPAVHLSEISSTTNDTRASLSFDGTFMLFGSGRQPNEGPADIFVTTRSKVRGSHDRDD